MAEGEGGTRGEGVRIWGEMLPALTAVLDPSKMQSPYSLDMPPEMVQSAVGMGVGNHHQGLIGFPIGRKSERIASLL